MRSITRRQFLGDSATLAAALASLRGLPSVSAAPVETKKASVNDRLRVAVIGVNGRGRDHVKGFANKHNCVVNTICDADSGVIGPAMTAVEKTQGKPPRFEQDLRRVLDDKSIDLVSIAMPNHWHALAAIWAMQAGKDVYVEKPVSHNVSEGHRIVETARRHQRICQTGTQIRSSPGMRQAIEFLHSGKLGKVKVARGLCYKLRLPIGKVDGPQRIPATANYDLWCGPAPLEPLMRLRLHYDWHWFWDYGNGDLGNQGIHQMDVARWGLGKSELPPSVVSLGGRFGYVDDGQTANTQICLYDYGDSQLIFEVRGLLTTAFQGAKIGNIFHCEKGMLVCPGYDGGVAYSPSGEVLERFRGAGDHYGNFVQAVRERKPELLNADILEGHLSSALCHLGNISYRLGTLQPFNNRAKAFGEDREAHETLARMEEHLRQNRVPLDKAPYRLGRKLRVDPRNEAVIGDAEASGYLSRGYRKPFVIA